MLVGLICLSTNQQPEKNDTEAWEVYSALKTRTNPFNFPEASGEF